MQIEKIYSQYMYSFPHKKSYIDIPKETIENILDKPLGDIGIYIHIPFCSSKCGYCNLFSVVKNNTDYIDKYILKIIEEIEYLKNKIKIDKLKVTNLVIGGGTPFILSISQMEKIFEKLEDSFFVNLKEIDFQMETSPNETTLEKLEYLKKRGLKRLSIGVQSFVENELKNIYRQHSVKSATLALDNIKKVGFSKKNLDIIYGLPNQNVGSLIYSLKKALEYDFEEIFLYPLYVRNNTILNKIKTQIDEIKQFELYKKGVEFLELNGYKQISMRRFVKNIEKESESCGFEKSLSLGCGGRSYIDNIHFCEEYSSDMKKCQEIIDSYLDKKDFFTNIKGFMLKEEHLKIRFLIKNLGHIFGVNKKEYEELFNNQIIEDFPNIEIFINKKYIIDEEGVLRLTKEGLGYSDYILYTFIPEEMKDSFDE